MAIPASGYDSATISNPDSALTDFTLMIDLSTMSADWWSAVDTADGTKGRASKSDGTTELAVDWIDFDDGGETGWLRVKYSGSLASSGTQIVRVYPPMAANDSVAANATYGSDNAYDSNWKAYYPFGSGNDRTANGYDLTSVGSPPSGILKGLQSTDYDGSSQHAYNAVLDFEGWAELSIFSWVDFDVSVATNTVCGQWGGTTGAQTALLTIQSSNVVLAGIRAASNGFPTSTGTISDNTEAFVGVTHTTGAQKTYINGGADGSASATGNISASAGYNFGIGAEAVEGSPSNRFNGELNNISVHDILRSIDWITEEYDQTNDNAIFWGTWTWTAVVGGVNRIPIIDHHNRMMAIMGS